VTDSWHNKNAAGTIGDAGSVIFVSFILQPGAAANLHTNICLYQFMIGHLRIKSPWVQLAVLMAFPLVLILAGLLITTEPPALNLSDPEVVNSMKWTQAYSSLILFLLPAFLFAVFTFNGKYTYFLGLRKAERPNMYVLSILCILMAFPFVFWLGQLNQMIPLPPSMVELENKAAGQMEAFFKSNKPADVIINVIIIGLLPAICEELFFRGALQRILIQITKNPWAGIILTGFLFSALHLQFQGFFPRMFLGVVLGILYWYSGSLWTSILAHFVNNAVQVIAVSYAPKYINTNPDTPLLASLISGVAVWAILWFYRRQSTVTYSRVYRIDEITSTNQFIA
jgi:membrane protease YdiL (CAAX protease family)